MSQKKVGVLIGSNRKASYSRKMAHAIAELAPQGLAIDIIEIDQLPFYNQDLEDAGQQPQAWLQFREQVHACDALLFITPEYNRGLPALLKNAVDVGSRPYGKAVWTGKPGAVISISQGAMAGFGANHALRMSLVAVGVATMAHPEAYVGNVGSLFNEEGRLVADSTREFLSKFMGAFQQWIGS